MDVAALCERFDIEYPEPSMQHVRVETAPLFTSVVPGP
jgi:hypothetical protein